MITRFESEARWAEALRDELLAAAEGARGRSSPSLALCLAGGRTPEGAYRLMAATPIAGLAVELWPGDERAVPESDAARNGAMIARAFAGSVWRPLPVLHLWPPAASQEEAGPACARYQAELAAALGPAPVFDLAILGLGADGHTASLFPGHSRALEEGRLALPTLSPLPPFPRMSLSVAALASARRRIFLVRGADKAEALRRLEAGDPSIPASLLAGEGARVLYLP